MPDQRECSREVFREELIAQLPLREGGANIAAPEPVIKCVRFDRRLTQPPLLQQANTSNTRWKEAMVTIQGPYYSSNWFASEAYYISFPRTGLVRHLCASAGPLEAPKVALKVYGHLGSFPK